MSWYLLLVLVPVGIVCYLVWDHRRKAAEREAASAGRLNAILGAVVEQPLSLSTQNTNGEQPQADRAAPAPAMRSYAPRERLLTPRQTLLYYLLKTGLPDHLVFGRVELGAVLDAAPALSGFARDEQLRRLAGHAVDFVVCDRNMRPVAVVQIGRPDSKEEAAALRKSWLVASGLRYVELAPDALPRKEAIRTLILGEPALQGSA